MADNKNVMTATFFLLVRFVFGISFILDVVNSRFTEEKRLQEYTKRNYSWPISEYHPNTSEWNALWQRRIQQVESMSSATPIQVQEKYDAWLIAMWSSLVAPNFTQHGWAVTKIPQSTWWLREIQDEVYQQMSFPDTSLSYESYDPAIVGDHRPYFVPLPDHLRHQALHDLKPIFESWSSITLRPQSEYGLRVYQNSSSLYMHIDQRTTHVISGILHIDHSDDSQPWPLVIEDFDGNTQLVILEKGDMLLYESSKCLHGRPIPFNGSWYTSLFLHYSPLEDKALWNDSTLRKVEEEPHFAIPPHWNEERTHVHSNNDGRSISSSSSPPPRLRMVDTAMMEPECPPYQWCLLNNDRNGSRQGKSQQTKVGMATSSYGTSTTLSSLSSSPILVNDKNSRSGEL